LNITLTNTVSVFAEVLTGKLAQKQRHAPCSKQTFALYIHR